MARKMVTTTDNPFNYFTQFRAWKNYDEDVAGYYTCNYVARIIAQSPELSPKEYENAEEIALDEIVDMDLRFISPVTGKETCYVKVIEE